MIIIAFIDDFNIEENKVLEKMKHNNYKAVAKERIKKGSLCLDLSNMKTRSTLKALEPLNLPKLDDLTFKMHEKPLRNDDKKEIIDIIKNSFPTQVKKLEIKNDETIEINYWLEVLESATQRVKKEFCANNFSASLNTFDRTLKAFSKAETISMDYFTVDTTSKDLDDAEYRDFNIQKIHLSDIETAKIDDIKHIINILARHDKLKSNLDLLYFENPQISEDAKEFINEINKHVKDKGFEKIKKATFEDVYLCNSKKFA